MARYSAQFRNTILKKLLPPESRTAVSLAREYNLSVTTIYGWKARMKHSTLGVEEGVLSNRERPFALCQNRCHLNYIELEVTYGSV